jgi:N-acetylglucosamine kinase-like BadF-type ATPase
VSNARDRPPSERIVLAVDGGNSKTDLALVAGDGRALALVRGPRCTPQYLGAEGCLDVIESLLDEALLEADLKPSGGPFAEIASLLLAGVDFPSEERDVEAALRARKWAVRTFVGNDTFAVLRAGTERGWGVAVVCGSGINCVGVAPDGREARFPSLGAITGDWGGGYDVGLAAVFAAARSEDGRGPKTTLEHAVPEHFGLGTPQELAEEFHGGSIPEARAIELAPVVFAEAARDPVSAEIIDRLASEVVSLARVALTRLDLTREHVEVLLGGGLLQAGDGRLVDAVRAGLEEVGPALTVRRTASAPIVGAVLLALDRLDATPETKERARADLSSAAGDEID